MLCYGKLDELGKVDFDTDFFVGVFFYGEIWQHYQQQTKVWQL